VSSVIICSPESCTYRAVRYCPTCEKRRRFVAMVFEWYPTIWTCLGCGDEWSEDGRQPRPFRRGWREDSKAVARERWASGVTRREAIDWLMAQVDR
jgi:ribosomal protein L37AE/L43A